MTFNSTDYRYTRYLSAKKSIDDRALNHHVLQRLKQVLSTRKYQRPLRVLETGAGIGTMIERLTEWQILPNAIYTAIDSQLENIVEANIRLSQWGRDNGYIVSNPESNIIELCRGKQSFKVVLENSDVYDFIEREQNMQDWDLIIAHAFLDLCHLETILPSIFSLLHDEGIFYFTINFDGVTILLPEIDADLDKQIVSCYHQGMDLRVVNGKSSGDSKTGRKLFQHLHSMGAQIVDAGSSDWVVFPTNNKYHNDEAYFLHFIINTIHMALASHAQLDSNAFESWITQRHSQIEKGELIYIAHQMDFLGRAPQPS